MGDLMEWAVFMLPKNYAIPFGVFAIALQANSGQWL
jgi:hypothetical protein